MNFSPLKYKEIGYDQLVTYCAFMLEQSGKEVTFEVLVKEVFENFPERFKLFIKDRNWPDAALINKSWLRARTDKQWIVGNRASGFNMTPAGRKIAEQVAKQLKINLPRSEFKDREAGEQTRSTRIVGQVLGSEAFKKYMGNKIADVTEFEFCDAIFCTLDTPPEIKLKHMKLVRQHAQEAGQSQVLKYLDELKSNFGHLLGSGRSSGVFKGGMMKQKL